jgi:hypothetical protein
MYIYIYVWKLNQTVLELDLWTDKFLFFSRRNLNTIDTLQHQSLSLMSSALDLSTTSAIYIPITYIVWWYNTLYQAESVVWTSITTSRDSDECDAVSSRNRQDLI